MVIEKAEGVNESERYLQKLCDKTFLSLWSYPAVHKEKGNECCDLLVVFENHIIIFSDKDCQFPNSGQLELDWNRWFKKAIQKSAQQAWGAERWIKKYPNKLFLDSLCEKPFPIEIPDLSTAKFHLVIIAHDSSDRCQQELSGRGSLIINSSLKGFDTHKIPFMIGDIEPSRAFVHVLDDNSLDILLKTLDTISDFVSYLSKKEKFLRTTNFVFAYGEEELLAFYLTNWNDKDEHYFVDSSTKDEKLNYIVLEEGHWDNFMQSRERQAQLDANKISYIWDSLIETFNKNVIDDTLYFNSHAELTQVELLLRFFAKESRLRRRLLSQTLVGFIQSAQLDIIAIRYLASLLPLETYYVFTTVPLLEWMKDNIEKYRLMRRNILEICCLKTKLKFPDAQHIVGIATEPHLENEDIGHSQDAMYCDATNWTKEDFAKAEEQSKKLDIFYTSNMFSLQDYEYPTHSPIIKNIINNEKEG